MIKLAIDGMSCGHCTAAVEKALLATEGVEKVTVSLDPGQAEVEGSVNVGQLIAVIEDEGYEARLG